mgnify:CR=1 FL=1
MTTENTTSNSIPETIQSWDDLEDLNPQLLRGIFSYGFEKPSPIQQKTIPHIMKGHDIVAQAQSGTGKTASFTIGGLSLVDTNINETQLLILSPTKELTNQTANVVENIGSLMHNLRVQCAYGGSSYSGNGSGSGSGNSSCDTKEDCEKKSLDAWNAKGTFQEPHNNTLDLSQA